MLYFRMQTLEESGAGPFHYVDKIPLKNWEVKMGVRVVPPATVRFGAYVAPGSVIMPSYVNIGAYVGEGTMVDTWPRLDPAPNWTRSSFVRRSRHWWSA